MSSPKAINLPAKRSYEDANKLLSSAQGPAFFKHCANSGDLIYAMAGIKALCNNEQRRAVIMQAIGMKASYYEGATHPFGDRMMVAKMWAMLVPLIEYQDYIEATMIYNGEPTHYDLDLIRTTKIGLPNGNIAKWYSFIYPQLRPNLEEPWLDVPHQQKGENQAEGTIICNFTERYRNTWVHYGFLQKDVTCRKYHILFVGTEKEFQEFKQFVPRAQLFRVNNFLSLACALSVCKLFIGNQSMCFAIAEAMKIPRCLELCWFAPNVDPAGPNAMEFYSQSALEYNVITTLSDTDKT